MAYLTAVCGACSLFQIKSTATKAMLVSAPKIHHSGDDKRSWACYPVISRWCDLGGSGHGLFDMHSSRCHIALFPWLPGIHLLRGHHLLRRLHIHLMNPPVLSNVRTGI